MLAFRTANDVGVDVEFAGRRFDLEDLARGCFSSLEQESMRALSPEGRIARFFDLWTAKEAYIKALGGGVSIPLQEFSVGIVAGNDSWNVDTTYNRPGPTLIRRLDAPGGYAGAVTTIGSEWRVEIFDIPSGM